ncbi:MAG TPA: YbjQ family protein [Acidimicrobiales bacterium]|nr:YbjQ family protein [Acidimicrobiales bacterium]
MSQAYDQSLPLPCSTTFDFAGWRVERQIGLCWGLVVRSVGFVKGFTGSIRSLRAGEVDEYTAVLEQARRHALERLVEHARAMGANAIAGVRFDSSEIGNNLSEIIAYGTAVVVVAT